MPVRCSSCGRTDNHVYCWFTVETYHAGTIDVDRWDVPENQRCQREIRIEDNQVTCSYCGEPVQVDLDKVKQSIENDLDR